MAPIDRRQYWRIQSRRITGLLIIWFIAGYLMSILFIEPLNQMSLGGIPFGFWMAQQGSILVFVLLILVFAWATGRLDRRSGLSEGESGGSDVHAH